jgi:hypothetical protein
MRGVVRERISLGFRRLAVVLLLLLVGAWVMGLYRAEPPRQGDYAVPPVQIHQLPEAAIPWVVNPQQVGADLPPVGRSLFDRAMGSADDKQGYDIPFPFVRLIEKLNAQMTAPGVKAVLIPLGRSLQRNAAAPEFFRYPRVVVAALGDVPDAVAPGLLLKDRLYIGYHERANVLEVISYNETAARFEFQIVKDYAAARAPKVLYANRGLCLSCHQNAAPIFARPLWDETHANPMLRETLAAQARDFYGIPLRQGVDVAYEIDAATDRANGLSLTQTIWQIGCGAEDAALDCRAALLRAAWQLRLSQLRGYDITEKNGLAQIDAQWRRVWPQGVNVPTADIPNRDPLAVWHDGRLQAASLPSVAVLQAQNNIPGSLEPLRVRAPAMQWPPPDKQAAVDRAVLGASEFFAQWDVQQLAGYLASQPVEAQVIQQRCDVAYIEAPGDKQYKVTCHEDANASFRFRGYMRREADGIIAAIQDLYIQGHRVGALRLMGHAQNNVWQLRAESGDVYLPNADALTDVTIAPNDPSSWTITLRLAKRGRALDALIDDMVDATQRAKSDALSSKPLRRDAILAAMSVQWDKPVQICCDGPMPPPQHQADEVAQRSEASAQLHLLMKYCGNCHGNSDAFPPNFLFGSMSDVSNKLQQCSERIYYRLGLWILPEAERAKAAMPPMHALSAHHLTPEQWGAHSDLRAIQSQIGEWVSRDVAKNMGAFLQQDYGALAPCLQPMRAH